MTSFEDIPLDILSIIFDKIGSYEILCSAQFVCRDWFALSLDPRTWRHIYLCTNLHSKFLQAAVNRSAGGLVDFDGHGVNVVAFELIYVLLRSHQLQKLTFVCDGWFHSVLKQVFMIASLSCPLLKDIGMYGYSECEDDIEYIGQLFPKLEKFRLERDCNFGAVAAIAKNMGGLIELQLSMFDVKNDHFRAILDGCPHLKFLGVITKTHSDILLDDDIKERLKNIQACEIYDNFDHKAIPLFQHGRTREWKSEICIQKPK